MKKWIVVKGSVSFWGSHLLAKKELNLEPRSLWMKG